MQRSSAQGWNPGPGYQDREEGENSPPKQNKCTDAREEEQVNKSRVGQGEVGQRGISAQVQEGEKSNYSAGSDNGNHAHQGIYRQTVHQSSEDNDAVCTLGNLLNLQETCYAAAITQVCV